MNIFLKLYLSFLKIGLFGFGGGYAMLPLIKTEIVDSNQWLTMTQFSDIVAISQMTPGPIALNSATFVGYMVIQPIYGSTTAMLGSALATFGVCTPPIVFMILLSIFYLKSSKSKFREKLFYFLKPATIGLIGAAAITMMDKETFIDWISYIIFIGAFIATIKKIDPIKLIIISGIIGLCVY